MKVLTIWYQNDTRFVMLGFSGPVNNELYNLTYKTWALLVYRRAIEILIRMKERLFIYVI